MDAPNDVNVGAPDQAGAAGATGALGEVNVDVDAPDDVDVGAADEVGGRVPNDVDVGTVAKVDGSAPDDADVGALDEVGLSNKVLRRSLRAVGLNLLIICTKLLSSDEAGEASAELSCAGPYADRGMSLDWESIGWGASAAGAQ